MNVLSTLLVALEEAAEVTAARFNAAGLMYIGIGLIAIGMGFSSIGEGFAVSSALQGMARNPEASGNLRSSMILGVSLCETCAIYGLVICMLLIFVVNPMTIKI